MRKVEICGIDTSAIVKLSPKESAELLLRIKEGDKAARDIFTGVLKHALPASLAKKLKYFTIPELAQLAAYLLDVKFSDSQVPEESISAQALEKSIKRLKEKIR